MADTVKNVNIRIKVTDNLKDPKKGFDELNQSVDKTTKNVESSVSKMDNSIKKLGATMIGAFAIQQVVGDAVKRIKEFDQSIANLSAITGATGGDLDKFKKAVLDVSANTGKGASEIAKAFQLVGSAKPELLSSAEALGAVTEQAVILAQAGGLEVPAAAEALTKAMNQFGAGADDAAYFTDVLATAQQKGTATILQTSEALKNAGANANAAGLSFEETNVAIQALAKGGLVGSEAGTGLSAALIKLSTQADSKINPSLNSLQDVVKELASRNLDLVDATKLVGPESAKTLLTLAKQEQVVTELTGALYEQGNAMRQAATITSTVGGEMEKLDSAYERVILQFEDGTGPISETIKGWITMTTEMLSLVEAIEKGEGALERLTEIGARQLVQNGQMTQTQADLAQAYTENATNIAVLQEWQKSGKITTEEYQEAVHKLLRQGWEPATKGTEDNTAALEENAEAMTGSSGKAKAVTGSLQDYEQKIKALSDSLKGMRLGSDEFLETKERINDLKDEVKFLSSGLTDEDLKVDPIKSLGLDNDTISKIGEGEKKKTEVILEEMKERNEKKREETAADFEMNLEMERAFAESKAELNQANMLGVLDLAAAVAQAAGDSQEAQIAALAFQKVAALANVAINTSTAIAAATAPPPIGLGPVLGAGLVPGLIANGAIQAGIILATAIPQARSITQKKLKDGEVLIDGPGTETSDSIPALLSKNESVINAKSSKKHTGALKAINDDRFEQWLEAKVMQELYMRKGKGIMNKDRAGAGKTTQSFPKGFAVTNPSSISGPIAKAIEEQNFLNRNSW